MIEPIDLVNSPARQRVLNVAEQLFREHGYAAVSLRDIAEALGMQKASLYYHAPDGKEGLFFEVMKRSLERHRRGLAEAIQSAGTQTRERLAAAARWLISQPVLNYGRMMQSDMPAISEARAGQLRALAYESLIMPLHAIFADAVQLMNVAPSKAVHLAGAFLAIVEAVQNLPTHFATEPKESMVDFLIDTLFKDF